MITRIVKLLYILLNFTQKAQKCFALQNGGHTDHTDEYRLLFREAMIRRGDIFTKIKECENEK